MKMCVFLPAVAVVACLLSGDSVAADNSGAGGAAGAGDFCVTPHSDEGRCVPLRSCPPLLGIARQKPINPEAVAFLRSSECSFGVSKIRIFCCATHKINEKPPIRNLFSASSMSPKADSLPTSPPTEPPTEASNMTSSTTVPPTLAKIMTPSKTEPSTLANITTSSTTVPATLANIVKSPPTVPPALESIMTSSPTDPPTLDNITTSPTTVPATLASIMTSSTTTTESAAVASTEGVLATPGPGPADAEGHPNDRLLPRMCGPASSLDSPFEAREAELHEHPWTVLLRYDGGASGSYFGCAGALISRLYVLTAAHCTSFGNPRGDSLKSALVGEHEVGVSPDCRDAPEVGGEECADAPVEVPVEREIVHPEFSRIDPTRGHDVALLRLDADVVSTIAEITPICLPAPGIGIGSTTLTSQASLAGWGIRGKGVSRSSKWQGSVELASCPATLDARTQTCAVRGDGACALDDGGVLVGVGVDGLHVLAIAAHSLPRCSDDVGAPAVLTRVDAFVGWIVDQLEP